MNALLHIGLSNAAIVALLAAIVLPLARWAGKPALTHALCVLLLLKLFVPPLVNLPVWIRHAPPNRAQAVGGVTEQQSPRAHGSAAEDFKKSPVESFPQSLGSSTEIPAIPGDVRTTDILLQNAIGSAATRVDRAATISPPASAAKGLPLLSPSRSPSRWMMLRTIARDQWQQWVSLAWFSTAVAFGAIAGARIVRLRRALNRTAVEGPPIIAEMNLLAGRLGIRKLPRVQFVSASISPMLVALFGRPRLVTPIAFWNRLDAPRRRALLLHELAHLRRGDHWVRYLESLCMCLYWWNPAVWFVRAMLRDAEEQCCDAWVVWAMPGESRTYMSTLLDAVDFLSQSIVPRAMAKPMLASGMGQFHRLHRRLIMVREQNVQRRLGLWGLSGMALASVLALPLGAEITRGDDHAAPSGTGTISNALPGAGAGTTPPLAPAAPVAPAGPTAPVALPAGQDPAITGVGSAAVEPPRLPTPPLVPGGPSVDPHDQAILEADKIDQLKAELLAAQANVQRLQYDLAIAESHTHLPHLGHILFSYQAADGKNQLLAYDRGTLKQMWSLDVTLNDKSVIQCYDNDTLLVRADNGTIYLLNAESGSINQSFAPGAPGAPAPAVAPTGGVNPFEAPRTSSAYRIEKVPGNFTGTVAAPPAMGTTPHVTLRGLPGTSSGTPAKGVQSEEERLRRMEDSIQALTRAVDRLTEQQNRQSAPAPERR